LVVLKEREVSLKNVVVAVAVLNFYVLHWCFFLPL
jgi:hypothetical protein